MKSLVFAVRAGWTLALGTAIASPFACGGKVVFVAEDGGAGGHGGAGASSSSSAPSSSTSGITSSSSSGVGGVTSSSSGSPPPCMACAEAISAANASNPCPGSAKSAYDALVSCICATGCPASCGDNVCIGKNITQVCTDCIQSTCAGALKTCENN